MDRTSLVFNYFFLPPPSTVGAGIPMSSRCSVMRRADIAWRVVLRRCPPPKEVQNTMVGLRQTVGGHVRPRMHAWMQLALFSLLYRGFDALTPCTLEGVSARTEHDVVGDTFPAIETWDSPALWRATALFGAGQVGASRAPILSLPQRSQDGSCHHI